MNGKASHGGGAGREAGAGVADLDSRPLTARSVVASTLLGTDPPRLPVSFLVQTGELFGFSDAAIRTALSRMVANGEASRDGSGHYELAGHLIARQRRLLEGRSPIRMTWDGTWSMYVVTGAARSSADRAELRGAMKRLRIGELREGVWLRPDNLDPERLSGEVETVDSQCQSFNVMPTDGDRNHDGKLVSDLWDLAWWAAVALRLTDALENLLPRLESGDTGVLRPGFVLSAAVLRHFATDPLLPETLEPPDWPGDLLRDIYLDYDNAYRALLSQWTAGSLHGE